MRFEREIEIVRIPLWYRIVLRGSLFGILLGVLVGLTTAGLWGLFVFALLPLLLLLRLARFESRTVRLRITDALEIVEGSVSVAVPFRAVSVREHHRHQVELEIRFPYRGAIWRGIIAHKDAPGSITVGDGDDPALYAQVRGTLKVS